MNLIFNQSCFIKVVKLYLLLIKQLSIFKVDPYKRQSVLLTRFLEY